MAMAPIHNVSIQDHANVHLGDVYHVYHNQERDGIQAFGLCWGSAPLISVHDFIGRIEELQHMAQILQPGKPMTEQRRLVLGGMGGIGKTQLAISYARRNYDRYNSVFWLNATTELTLKAGFRSIAQNIVSAKDLESFNDEQVVGYVHQWLCNTDNGKWLLLLDNYDDPEQFEIEKYRPNIGHGSVIITSRLPERVQGDKIRLSPLKDISECLDILRTRSQREIRIEDPAVRSLVSRLGGLPLALATAGAYLSRGSVTMSQYLQAYEQRWKVDPRRPPRLRDYENRTLYTTWDLTYYQLKIDDPDAARLLKLMAYFNNQEILYKLLQAGLTQNTPTWLQQLLVDVFSFESVISTLMEYCLVEKIDGCDSYSIHNCIHDWTFAELNETLDLQLYWFAFQSVVSCIDMQDWSTLGQPHYYWTALHARRLTHERFRQYKIFELVDTSRIDQAVWIAQLLANQNQLESARWMYEQILMHRERDLGPTHILTLHICRELGVLFHIQDRFTEAESQYERAIFGYKKTLGLGDARTLTAIDNLGCLYTERGLLSKAEALLQSTLTEYTNSLGADHASMLTSTNCMRVSYSRHGEIDNIEHLLKQLFQEQGDPTDRHNTIILPALQRLGIVYSRQGKTAEAEECFMKALGGYECLTASDSHLTPDVINNIGVLYSIVGRLEDAERMYLRALIGLEKTLGPHSVMTLSTTCSLGRLYSKQRRLEEAEHMYLRCLAGREKTLGFQHPSTIDTVCDLGTFYIFQEKSQEAEQIYLHAISKMKDMVGSDHALVSRVISGLGYLYGCMGPAELENRYNSSISGKSMDDTPRLSLVIGLAASLTRSAMLAENQKDTTSWLSRLVRLLNQSKDREYLDSEWYLTKPLLKIRDDTNAQIALVRRIRQSKKHSISILCDGCDRSIEQDTGRHICRQCVDIDTCNECMLAYRESRITFSNCDDHEFFDAGSAIANLLETPNFEKTLETEEWLEKLKRQYPMDEAEYDRLLQSSTLK